MFFFALLMAACWTTEETRALVSIWAQENVQSELDGVQKNRKIYERISRELRDQGHHKRWQQFRTKVKNLIQKYRKVLVWCQRICLNHD